MSKVIYREAEATESGLILKFIRELADYENLLDEVTATEDDIKKSLFGSNPNAFCVFADIGNTTVGFTICFYNYSTFKGKYGIHVDDLYVRQEYRGQGIGKGFFKYIARKASVEKCSRVDWVCLDWNKKSIEFYKKLGARAMEELITFRLEDKIIDKIRK